LRLYVEARNEIDVELLAHKILDEIERNYKEYDPDKDDSPGQCGCTIV